MLCEVTHGCLSFQHFSIRGESRQACLAGNRVCAVVDVVQTGRTKAKDRPFALISPLIGEALSTHQISLVPPAARGGA